MAQFGFRNLQPVDTIGADLSHTVDLEKLRNTPAATVIENIDFLPGLGQPAQAPPQAWRPSALQRIGSALQGISEQDLIEKHAAKEQAIANRSQLQSLMRQVLKDPREQLAFIQNPNEWAKSVATNFGAANVEGGATRVMPGFGAVTAPKVFESGDSVISATPDEMAVLGRREPSYEEEAKAENNARLAEIKELLANNTLDNTRSLIAKRSRAPASSSRGSAAPAAGGSPWLKYRKQ